MGGTKGSMLGRSTRVAVSLLVATYLISAEAGGALAQTRADCDAGVVSIKNQLTRVTDAGPRAKLERALRNAERASREEEYDECMDALEEVGVAGGADTGATQEARRSEPDESMGADGGLPVTIEDAFVPSPGEIEAQLHFLYDNQRRRGEEDERSGRHLFTPEAEVEIGILEGISASLGVSYGLGNAEDAKSGEVEAGAKWNFLSLQGMGPALSVSGAVSVPYGYSSGDSVDATVSLLGSQPLGGGADAPFMHVNLSLIHTFNREEESRVNSFVGVLGVAVPIADSTALIADFAHEQREEKGKIDNLIEIGLRREIFDDITVGAGVGAGVGGSITKFRALVGVQTTF